MLKMNLKKLVGLIFGIVFFNTIHAQLNIEKYLKQIDTIKLSKDKVRVYLDISWEYFLIENDSSLLYSEKAYQLASKNNNHYEKVLSLESKGLYYESVKNDYEKAISLYINAIDIDEKNNLNYSNSLYLSLGILCINMEDNETAARYLKKSIDISRKKKSNVVLGYGLENYGTILKKLNRLEEAEKVFLECIAIDSEDVLLTLSSYSNLGSIYESRNQLQKAHGYYKKSLQIPKNKNVTIRYLPIYVAALKNVIAVKDVKGIDSLVTRIYDFANQGVSLKHKASAFEAISEAHFFKEEYKQATITLQKSKSLNDSLNAINLKETTYELERKYENIKTRTALTKEINVRKTYTLGVVILFVFIVILVFFFYKRNKRNKILAEQKKLLEKTIGEKNMLLKETHHRVKNSFQIVSGLLFLQTSNIKDKLATKVLMETQNRINSMAVLHQKLYQQDHTSGIDCKDYINALLVDILSSYSLPNIDKKIFVEPIVMDIEVVTSIGLIINELVTNSLKYAFPKKGTNDYIEIKLHQKETVIVLEVIDNGIGISEKDYKKSSLGLSLVKDLSDKISGEISFECLQIKSPKGTKVTIVLNEKDII